MHKSLFTPFTRGLLAGAILITAVGLAAAQSAKSFRPGEVWRDTDGQPIRAHDGGFCFENGVYYWFGEDKRAGGSAGHTHAIACYSSRDLYNWKNEGNVAPEIGPQEACSPNTRWPSGPRSFSTPKPASTSCGPTWRMPTIRRQLPAWPRPTR